MATPEEVVTRFLAGWEEPDGFGEACRSWFTPETVWENVGMSKTTGPEAAAALFANMGDGSPLVMRVENLHVVADGNSVLTERLDHVLGPDGAPAMTIRVMGTFEIEGEKIVAWRDYFDTAGFAQQG